MRVGFTAAVAGWRNPHQARVELILHIAFQDAVFNQHVVLPRHAFIVDRQRTAAALQGAVIHHSAQFGSHQLPDLAAEHRGAAAVEVAFQAVTDRLMQQHARPTGAEHYRHRARRRGDGGKVHQRHAHRFFGKYVGAHFTVHGFQKIVIAETAAAAAGATFAFAVLFHQHADGKAHQRAHVCRQRAVGRRDQHLLIHAGDAGADFLHAGIGRARSFVYPVQQRDFLFTRQALQRIKQRIQRLMADFTQGMHLAVATVAHNAARSDGALVEGVEGDLIGIGKTGLFTADRTHPNPLIDIVKTIFDDAVFKHPGFMVAGLEIEIGVIKSAFCQLTQYGEQVLMTQLIRSE